jgi:anthranilate phosphoribosyltransferase
VTDTADVNAAHDDSAAANASELAALGGWPGVITGLVEGRDLNAHEAATAMGAILTGAATPAQLIAFTVALRIKGETADELSGLLDAVLAAADLVPLDADTRSRAVDVVGTGGDRSHSINVSTMAAIVVAGAGVPVCKHGARGASSLCGTADVLEALGVAIELSPAGVVRCVEEAGIGFCFAPRFHPAFRFAAPARREVGIPLVFNLLGPMANPGRVRRQLIGVADARFAERMLASLRAHGTTDAWVVHGGGLDELTTTGPSTVLALDHDGGVRTFEVDPVALGLAPATHDQLVGGDPAHNAEVVHRVLGGEHGAHRDIVILNAGAALVVAGVATALEEAVAVAAASIDSGRAAATLDAFVATSQAARR